MGAPALAQAETLPLFSATGAVIALLAGELFLGEAEGHLDGSGTLAIRSQADSALSCRGEFTSNAAKGGDGRLQCSDGSTGTFSFHRLGLRSGHGTGELARGPINFTYGLSADESRAYLELPAGFDPK